MKIFALLLTVVLISPAYAQDIKNIKDLSLFIVYVLPFIFFPIYLAFVAIKGKKIIAFLLALIMPQLFPSVMAYFFYFFTANFLTEGLFITIFIFPFVAMLLTFMFLIKIGFLKELMWLKYLKKLLVQCKFFKISKL